MIGKLVEDLVICNLEIWHNATRLKDFAGKLRKDSKLSPREQIAIHTQTRVHNAKRSKLRYEIDRILDTDVVNETKIDYLTED